MDYLYFYFIGFIIIMYLPIPIIQNDYTVGYFISVFFYVYILFIILYRPIFLNKS